MLKLNNLTYEVFDENKHEKTILKNIDLTFPKNKMTVVTGPNGSGKSTLIKLLMGVLSPSSGEIFYKNEDITNLSISQRANLGITMAFQQPVRFKGLTVKDLLTLASKKNTNVSDACDYLARVGLCARDYINRPLDDTLSGGELKRIELAMALAKGGDVLLFDEPEAGIDLWSFEGLVNLFKNLKDKTIIIVSHQKKIIDNADFVLLLGEGGTFEFGKKNEIVGALDNPRCGKLGGVQ